MGESTVEILLIEDNDADIDLFQEALRSYRVPCHLSVLRDGNEALAFLRREGPYVAAPRPALIVLDLHVPGISGDEAIKAFRSLPDLQPIPLVIFSAVAEEEGKQRSVQLGAKAFVHKPLDLETFFAAVHTIVRHWGEPAGSGQREGER